MRFVEKKAKCAAFEEFLENEKHEAWNDLRDPAKKELEDHLLGEQKTLCIYCQQKLAPKPTKKGRKGIWPCHIEHVRPKDKNKFPHLMWEHSNLSVSCNGHDVKAEKALSPTLCGHHKDRKQTWYEEGVFLHPFEEPGIEAHFEFDIEGRILAKNSSRAERTIKVLNLDSAELTKLRRREITEFSQKIAFGEIDTAGELDPNQPELPKFFSVLRQLFGLA